MVSFQSMAFSTGMACIQCLVRHYGSTPEGCYAAVYIYVTYCTALHRFQNEVLPYTAINYKPR